nr:uncharacterized protein LOC112027564 [Quercus suber]
MIKGKSKDSVLDGKRVGGFLTKTGVDVVIKQLGDIGKVVSHPQVKNKWDHLRKLWKQYHKCFDIDTGLGIDARSGMLDTSDDCWTRKIVACPNAKTFKKWNCLPNRDSMEGTIATGKNALCTSGQIPKATTEGSGDYVDSTKFVDPLCDPL